MNTADDKKTLADRLNAANIVPVISIVDKEGRLVEEKEFGIKELGCYAQFPLSDAKIYVTSGDEEAMWDEKWYDNNHNSD